MICSFHFAKKTHQEANCLVGKCHPWDDFSLVLFDPNLWVWMLYVRVEKPIQLCINPIVECHQQGFLNIINLKKMEYFISK